MSVLQHYLLLYHITTTTTIPSHLPHNTTPLLSYPAKRLFITQGIHFADRHLEQDGCGNYGVISSFDSSFSSLSSDSEDESIHIRKVGGNTSGPVVAAAESCAASRGASGRSRIPRIIPRIATDTTRTSKNTHLQRETAMSAAHLNGTHHSYHKKNASSLRALYPS